MSVRTAATPAGLATALRVPWASWKALLRDLYRRIEDDRLLAVAAGTVFYGLLALFPAITALVSCYALIARGASIDSHLAWLAGMMPPGGFAIVQDQVARVLAKGDAKLGLAFLASLAFALWSANGGTKAMIDALNVVYGEQEKRGFIRLNALSLGLTLGAIAAVLAAVGLVVATPIALGLIGLGGLADAVPRYGRWPLLAGLILLGLAVLYRFAPSHSAPRWRWISPGSVVATLAWLGGSALLSAYLANFADYDATYGSLGAAIGLMIWMWMSAIVVLLGAELNAALDHRVGAAAKRPDDGDHSPQRRPAIVSGRG